MTAIYTREQLIHEIEKILYNNFGAQGQFEKCAEELADFIATLDDDSEWKNIP